MSPDLCEAIAARVDQSMIERAVARVAADTGVSEADLWTRLIQRAQEESKARTRVHAGPPVLVYRGDIPTIDRIRPGFVADHVRRGNAKIVDDPARRET